MKYKLKKDLPFAKAGDPVFLSCGAFVVKDPYQNGRVLYIEDSTHKDKLINEGWIEEVKPREFIIALRRADNVPFDAVLYTTKDQLISPTSDIYYIKVIEVIE